MVCVHIARIYSTQSHELHLDSVPLAHICFGLSQSEWLTRMLNHIGVVFALRTLIRQFRVYLGYYPVEIFLVPLNYNHITVIVC